MANFNDCIDFVLKHEGGILKDASTGEYSNFGITQNLLRAINYRVTDPAQLVQADVWNIYLQQFWNKYRFDTFTSNKVAAKIMDMYVNLGPRNAGFVIQDALGLKNEFRDGILGPFTRAEINELGEDPFLRKLIPELEKYYTRIAEGPRAKYLSGWLTRAKDVMA